MVTDTLLKKSLLVGSNANNGSNAGLSYFNSNNSVSNANTYASLLYIKNLFFFF